MARSLTVMGVDPGSKCGVAIVPPTGAWRVERIDTPKSKHPNPGSRWARFRDEFEMLVRGTRPQVLVFEQVRGHRGTYAAQLYGGYRAHVLEIGHRAGCALVGIEPSALKRWATGIGNADKPRMVAAAQQRIDAAGATIDGHGPQQLRHDEADALLLALWYLAQESPVRRLTPVPPPE